MIKAKNKLTITIFASLFIAPMLIAIVLYNNPGLMGNKSRHHGILISPVLHIEATKSKDLVSMSTGKWTLLMVATASCQQGCQKGLHFLRQIQQASGKNQHRITRLLLSYQQQHNLPPHPGMQIAYIDKAALKNWLAGREELSFMSENGGIFIADPHGNIMLAYTLDVDYMDIFNDLRHLLTISSIG